MDQSEIHNWVSDLSTILGEMLDEATILKGSSLHSDHLMACKIDKWAADLGAIIRKDTIRDGKEMG